MGRRPRAVEYIVQYCLVILGHNQLWLFHYFLIKITYQKLYFNIGADDFKKIICYLFESVIPYANMNISFDAS